MQGPSFADKVQGVMSLISLGIILVVGIAVWNFCGNIMDAEADIPQPGSAADQMCDVNRERMNPDHVKYGDTWYDADCLLQYPWNEPLG